MVGDSDQSIYAFRGADIRNIQDFEQDFPNAKTIMLEQNYRSTQTILDAANAVIARNENRKPKKLWTALGEGDKIVGYAADNAQQEAGWIANEIARIHNEEGVAYRDIAIMYRANAQSRSLEEAMINANLPYQLVGGTKFYERREIKDALAYLQAIVNPADNVNVDVSSMCRSADWAFVRKDSLPRMLMPMAPLFFSKRSNIWNRSKACPRARRNR